jgi:hypothetical protein
MSSAYDVTVYYTRAVSRPIQQLCASTLLAGAIATALAASQGALDAAAAWAEAVRTSSIDAATASRIERLLPRADAAITTRNIAGHTALELVTITPSSSATAQPLVDAADNAIGRLTTWLGSVPRRRLTVVDAPAHTHLAGAAYPGIAVTSSRLFTTRREFAAERALTVAIARQYALAFANGQNSWFAEGMAAYFATRAVHETFEGRYYLTLRYFGGYVPHSLRAIVMSPNPLDPRPRVANLPEVFQPADAPWLLAHGADRDRAHRLTMALHTLERFIGWPALQATLSAFAERSRGATPSLADFVAVVYEQRGADLQWFLDRAKQ